MHSKPIRTSIIKIGNSQGVRLPKTLLALSGIKNDVEMVVANGTIIIRSASKAREGWAESFESMAAHGDDSLLDAYLPTEWDEEGWEWQ